MKSKRRSLIIKRKTLPEFMAAVRDFEKAGWMPDKILTTEETIKTSLPYRLRMLEPLERIWDQINKSSAPKRK